MSAAKERIQVHFMNSDRVNKQTVPNDGLMAKFVPPKRLRLF